MGLMCNTDVINIKDKFRIYSYIVLCHQEKKKNLKNKYLGSIKDG